MTASSSPAATTSVLRLEHAIAGGDVIWVLVRPAGLLNPDFSDMTQVKCEGVRTIRKDREQSFVSEQPSAK